MLLQPLESSPWLEVAIQQTRPSCFGVLEMNRRDQLVILESQDLADEAHVIVDQRVGTLSAIGQGFAQPHAHSTLQQLAGQAKHHRRFATEGRTGTDQQGGGTSVIRRVALAHVNPVVQSNLRGAGGRIEPKQQPLPEALRQIHRTVLLPAIHQPEHQLRGGHRTGVARPRQCR